MTDDTHTNDGGIDEQTTDDTEENRGMGSRSRRTVLGTLLGLGALSVVGTTQRASASPPKARPWNQNVNAQGNDLFNLGSLAMAANETEITDFEGEHLSIDDDGVLNATLDADATDADTLDGVDWDDVGGRYLQWNVDEQVLEFTGPAEWGSTDDFTNTASGEFTSVGGGQNNTASGKRTTVGGGRDNEAVGYDATIGGGRNNIAKGKQATPDGISGGATVSGGTGNEATRPNATIGGGTNNKAIQANTTIGGGIGNKATRQKDTIGGGEDNITSGLWATIGGGKSNEAEGFSSTVAGGRANLAGTNASVGGGIGNEATGNGSTVSGGNNNIANDFYTTVGGGTSNAASQTGATVCGGGDNKANSEYASIIGGTNNTASGMFAMVTGGSGNTASGDTSFAAGNRAKTETSDGTVHDGAFVWGDSTATTARSERDDQFVVQAGGGVTLYSSSDLSAGVELAPGSGSWSSLSTRTAKTDVSSVDPRTVLDSVETLDIATWAYTAEDNARHMGPMAEDFYEAFGLGPDEEHITSVDADGVALAAIQGLSQKLDEAHEEIDTQAERIENLETEVDAKDDRIDTLEAEQKRLRERLSAIEERLDGVEAIPTDD
jgi:hypothetical protein